jgi:hypothetical protein
VKEKVTAVLELVGESEWVERMRKVRMKSEVGENTERQRDRACETEHEAMDVDDVDVTDVELG